MTANSEFPRNVKNKNLSGVNFKGCDIRGLDFSGSNLTDADFSGVIAGTKRTTKILLISSFAISTLIFIVVLEFAGQRTGERFIYRPTDGLVLDEYGINLWIAIFTALMYTTSFVTIHKGIQIAAQFTVGIGISGILLASGHMLIRGITRLIYNHSGETIALYANRVIAPTVTGGITGVALLILSLTIAITMSATMIAGNKSARNWLTFGAYATATVVAGFIFKSGNHPITALVSWVIGLAGVFLGNKTSLRALENDERFQVVKSIAVFLSSIGGTSFRNTNLSDVNFSCAKLKSTDFRQENIDHSNTNRTCWREAEFLDYSRFGNTILDSPAVRELLRTGEGSGENYQGCNLKGAYLADAKLDNANLTEADISHAKLVGANLKSANLKKAQALGTNFYKANLTGACLEAWNVDSTTALKGSICDYVYLLSNKQEKCPSSGSFQDNEFGKLFQKVISTVDFIFGNGVSWQAFLSAFEQVRIENQDIELEIQSIESKGDDVVVVKVNVPPTASKQEVHSSLTAYYDMEIARLKAHYEATLISKNDVIETYRSDLKEIIKSLAAEEKKKFEMHFNAPVASVVGYAEGDQVIDQPNGAPSIQSYSLEELVTAITPENIHSEIETGTAQGNEAW
jgi:uncharacterized protein YjbI with pentapeptide repeats